MAYCYFWHRGVVVPLLVAYGVITSEQGELWSSLVLAIVATVVAIVVPITVTPSPRTTMTTVTAAAVELEHTRLMAYPRAAIPAASTRPLAAAVCLHHPVPPT